MLQNLSCPLIQALSRRLCCNEGTTMDFGRNAKQQLARGRLLRVNAFLLALREVFLNGLFELGPQLRNGFTVETDDAADSEDAANKDVVALVVLDAGGVTLVGHGVHGSTPTRSKSSRASST